jgi:hypothetical protein
MLSAAEQLVSFVKNPRHGKTRITSVREYIFARYFLRLCPIWTEPAPNRRPQQFVVVTRFLNMGAVKAESVSPPHIFHIHFLIRTKFRTTVLNTALLSACETHDEKRWEVPHFSSGRVRSYFRACTVKRREILKVERALVKPVHCLTR